MLEKFIKNIEKSGLNNGNRILIAVSGGVDSVVLTRLAVQYFSNVCIAHCNFQLRGEESKRDEQFVRNLAKELNVPFYIISFETEAFAEKEKITIQEAARTLRYKWFNEILEGNHLPEQGHAHQTGHPQFLLTAHHADDQIETFFIHLNRGSGLRGLKGILVKNGKIIRPFLSISKQEIVESANNNNWRFVEDSSNESDKYSRNYFRHHILPAIETKFPKFGNSLLRNIDLLQGGFVLYEMKLRELMNNLVEYRNNEVHIPVRKLQKLPAFETVLWEVVATYGFSSAQLNDILHLLNAQTGKYVESESHQIFKHREWLIIVAKQSSDHHHYVIDKEGAYTFAEGTLLLKKQHEVNEAVSGSLSVQLDATKVEFPLLLRKWREGDYFYPLGLGKKKKVARFCIDQKMSKTDKEKVWVLEMNQKIVWVIGLRIDDRFKLSPNTKDILSLDFKKN
ncbi:tRNA lysidine(34) synthetase TilS [Gynurincola endophyticus]|uniref:tRNA lysidine(34) synthetase TilS n=1 Tax=Gynurincola endophyticus TaxID=2479004 RepID=UPI000F8E1F5D|nr:tRNA lysidine(34) synthetase TilS [Gynurincola endophyticus]